MIVCILSNQLPIKVHGVHIAAHKLSKVTAYFISKVMVVQSETALHSKRKHPSQHNNISPHKCANYTQPQKYSPVHY